MAGVVIVGAGQGGFQAAASLRAEGYCEPIVLIGDEAGLPYQRPPLSKGMLLGKQEIRHVTLRPVAFYEAHRIELIPSERVQTIDRITRQVQLESGRRLPYESLILATGARNRLFPNLGRTLEGVCYLRTLSEASEIKRRMDAAQSIVVIGGGFIGLEAAAAARALGKPVTVIEAGPRLMARVVAPVVSEYFLQTHTAQGVQILLNATIQELRGDGIDVKAVLMQDGTEIPADLVIVGIGVIPNTELAAAAGLEIANGISVDDHLRTADPNIFAIGDCAEYPNPFAGSRVRLESVQNAVDQAACVARTIMGKAAPYKAIPWFWTDQFDIKMQMAGIAQDYDSVVVRGDPGQRKFSVFYYKDGKLCAVDSINHPMEHLLARKLIAAKATVAPQQAADESFDLKAIAVQP